MRMDPKIYQLALGAELALRRNDLPDYFLYCAQLGLYVMGSKVRSYCRRLLYGSS